MQDKKVGEIHHRHPSTFSNRPVSKKYATLQPYMSQIQKRKKNKSMMRANRRKNQNQNSSKSFRIKQSSTASLRGKSKEDYQRTISNIVNKISTNKKNLKQNKIKSIEKVYHPANTSALHREQNQQNSHNQSLFHDLYVRVQNKHRREQSFRKNMYDHKLKMERKKSQTKSIENIQFNKFGYTEGNKTKNSPEKEKKPEPPKKNFRKNKYEALYSSVTSKEVKEQKKIHEPVKSENKFDFNKKQSNISINKEMDQLAKKQMQKFYRQNRSKQIEKSLQKSTQKYFKQSSNYRPLKSNNDIEIYISTAKNPSIHKVSGSSTQNTMDKKNTEYISSIKRAKQSNQLLEYEFDFQERQSQLQVENPSEDQSMNFLEESQFQKQRKQVERQYFHKHEPQIDWSQEDCQIGLDQ